MIEIGNVEDANAVEALGAHGVRHTLRPTIHATVSVLHGHEEQIAVDRRITLAAGTHDGRAHLGRSAIADVDDLDAVPATLEHEVAAKGEIGIPVFDVADAIGVEEAGRLHRVTYEADMLGCDISCESAAQRLARIHHTVLCGERRRECREDESETF